MKKFGVSFVLATSLMLMAAGCGTKSSSHSQTEQFSYEFVERSQTSGSFKCTTGARTFNSRAEYCEGLRSNQDNNPSIRHGSCAYELRKEAYQRNCGGTPFEETNLPWTKYLSTPMNSPGGCETGGPDEGTAIYPTLAHFCEMLQDREFHNDCALEFRMEVFVSFGRCPGTFQEY